MSDADRVERNPDATLHYEDGVVAALRRMYLRQPSRYRGVVQSVARELGVEARVMER